MIRQNQREERRGRGDFSGKEGRKNLEAELDRLNALVTLLRRCNHALLHASDEKYLLREVCMALVAMGRYRLCWVGYAEKDEEKRVRTVAFWGDEDSYLDKVCVSWGESGPGSDAPTGIAIRTGSPCRLQHLDRQMAGDAGSWQASVQGRDFGSVLSLPLILAGAGRPMGALTLYSRDPEGFSDAEVRLLEELAEDIASGIEHLHRRLERYRVEEALRLAEARYDGVLENTGTGTILIENDERIRFCNATFARMTGYTREEIVGRKKWKDFVVREDVRRMENYHVWRRAEPGRAPSVYECQFLDRNGDVRDVLMKVGMVEGTLMSVASFMDITEAKRARHLLHEREMQLAAVVNHLPGPVFVRDAKARVVFANLRLINQTGYNPEGEYCYAIFYGRKTPCPDCPVDRVFAGETVRREVFFPDDGRWYEVIYAPISGFDGTVGRVQVVFMDITERKAAESALMVREESLREENRRLRSAIQERWRFGGLVGKSQVMQEVYERILKAAAGTSSVIIYGESGTGKELTARAIHDMSERVRGPFVPVNCGAISENLAESAFFGHRKGAFTGADRDRHGYLAAADGGTLFLDEIGEIPLSMQVKLLRALDGGGFTPVGGTEVLRPDIRVIAATNRNLYDLLRENRMRDDFFYRIHIVPIRLPALRDRKEDLPLLMDHFFTKYGAGRVLPPITGKLLEAFTSHRWPGNVRELQNAVQRYLSLEKLDFLGERDSFTGAADELAEEEALVPRVDAYEKKLIVDALHRHQWHRENAAESLGIHRKTLFTKMKKFGLLNEHSSHGAARF
ncbi:sigma 54-interacting transcriptional regulator [Desulfobotulus sp. H1]|uniref:Sigma 54-interacting transcriptional regulator n=1 Tax=Desulfobotulus pelophilus TaxID=2823377 RepID=A0ABT3N5D8_9BACT|nr:sigma 54-interacting transcriptional regulator [Desulfobotulus pelophilus]MCW7752681.1 sigma 54-interacting transcriptional regulator [Desulfobotulus pelophilus]